MNTIISINILTLVLLIVGITILFSIIVVISRVSVENIISEKTKQFELEIKHKKDMLISNFDVQEKERKRFSRELHDSLISKLNIAILSIDQTGNNSLVQKQLEEGIAVARKISHDLSPPLLTVTPFQELIEEFIHPIKLKYEIQYLTNVDEDTIIVRGIKLELYRIFQETFNNIIKHSEADTICIYLRISSNYLSFMISDNGIGFDLKTTKNGLGINNIQLRAYNLKGRIKYRTTINKGTRLVFGMKLKNSSLYGK
jgi:signal transduction histidine kinase